MKNLISALCLMIVMSVSAMAQSTDEYKKAEFFVGYSNGQTDTGVDSDTNTDAFLDRSTFHGFNVSAVANVNRYFSIKGDVSGTYRSDDVSFALIFGGTTQNTTFRANRSLYNFLGGVQVKDNASTARLKPFGYALVGAGHARIKVKNLSCSTGINCSGFYERFGNWIGRCFRRRFGY